MADSAAPVPHRAHGTDALRHELMTALGRVPEHALIFTRAEVDAIAAALGGWMKLAAVLLDSCGSTNEWPLDGPIRNDGASA